MTASFKLLINWCSWEEQGGDARSRCSSSITERAPLTPDGAISHECYLKYGKFDFNGSHRGSVPMDQNCPTTSSFGQQSAWIGFPNISLTLMLIFVWRALCVSDGKTTTPWRTSNRKMMTDEVQSNMHVHIHTQARLQLSYCTLSHWFQYIDLCQNTTENTVENRYWFCEAVSRYSTP